MAAGSPSVTTNQSTNEDGGSSSYEGMAAGSPSVTTNQSLLYSTYALVDDGVSRLKGLGSTLTNQSTNEDGGSSSYEGMVKSAAVGAAVGTAAVVAVPVVLNAAGFTAAGVAAGSAAAAGQSLLYGGATTGAFSVLQSVGAAGLAATTKVGVIGAAGTAYGWWGNSYVI